MVTTIRLPDELHRILKKCAEAKGMTLNGYSLSLLLEMCREYPADEKNWSEK